MTLRDFALVERVSHTGPVRRDRPWGTMVCPPANFQRYVTEDQVLFQGTKGTAAVSFKG